MLDATQDAKLRGLDRSILSTMFLKRLENDNSSIHILSICHALFLYIWSFSRGTMMVFISLFLDALDFWSTFQNMSQIISNHGWFPVGSEGF